MHTARAWAAAVLQVHTARCVWAHTAFRAGCVARCPPPPKRGHHNKRLWLKKRHLQMQETAQTCWLPSAHRALTATRHPKGTSPAHSRLELQVHRVPWQRALRLPDAMQTGDCALHKRPGSEMHEERRQGGVQALWASAHTAARCCWRTAPSGPTTTCAASTGSPRAPGSAAHAGLRGRRSCRVPQPATAHHAGGGPLAATAGLTTLQLC
jgi:hypothetical protein